jgi:chaperonin cofactor prefoldin
LNYQNCNSNFSRFLISQSVAQHFSDSIDEFDEVEAFGEVSTVRLLVGEVLIHASLDVAKERTKKKLDEENVLINKLVKEREDIGKEMGELKQRLYAKFKNTINLDEE